MWKDAVWKKFRFPIKSGMTDSKLIKLNLSKARARFKDNTSTID